MNLTPRQTDVIVAIRNYRSLHGYSPTMQELADQLGTSKVTIFEHVGALEKKRVLKRDKHKARSLEIVTDELLPDEERPTKLPLLGTIAALAVGVALARWIADRYCAPLGEVINPMHRGSTGKGFFRSCENKPSASKRFFNCSKASCKAPRPTGSKLST